MTREIEIKIERLLRLCADQDLGGVLLNTQPNFAWLSAGGTNGVDSSRDAGVATLFVQRDGKRFVLANKIEMARITTEELQGQGYEPVEFAWEEEKANPELVAQLAHGLTTANVVIGADYSAGTGTRQIDAAISRERYQLTPEEIDRFRSLGADAGAAIGNMVRELKPGLAEFEVARMAVDALAKVGATSVVTLVAADERLQRYRHPVPKNEIWRNVLMVVVCARRNGLIASLTRLVSAGKTTADLRLRVEACAQVNAQLFAATRPGTLGSELYETAARGYQAAGFPGEEHLHHQGGAAGYRTRDWVAHQKCSEKVSERQAFAWNPSVSGAKVEETCLAFADHVEIITASPGWPTITVKAGDQEYLLPDVLEL
jgi:antitoxin VapB